jgi:osmotically inducible protein OsmC
MAEIVRNATAIWNGSGKDGSGTLTTQSGTLKQTAYSAPRRFGNEQGTNPEELIAAAHAGCFSMALAFQLSGAGHPPERIETKAEITITQESAGWTITGSALTLKAKVPGMSRDDFLAIADKAKAGCPVSRLLTAPITLNAELA